MHPFLEFGLLLNEVLYGYKESVSGDCGWGLMQSRALRTPIQEAGQVVETPFINP